MFDLAPEIIAIALLALGFLTAAGILLVLRAPRRAVDPRPSAAFSSDRATAEDPDHGFLLLDSSGHVLHAGVVLLSWLNLPPDAAVNLEFFAARAEPQAAFLDLCTHPGRTRFAFSGMMVEGQSLRMDLEHEPAMLVLLQRPDMAALEELSQRESAALGALGEIGAAMSSRNDLEETILTILTSVERLVPADIAEITVLDNAENVLVPYRLAGPPDGSRRLDLPAERYPRHAGLSGSLVDERIAILQNPGQNGHGKFADHGKPFPFQAYVGVPLRLGEHVIGTLELASLTERTYTQRDLEVLELLSGQAAVSLRHALTQAVEKQRAAELTGLAALTQAVGNLEDPQDLYAHLITGMQPLLGVELLGFLLINENEHLLEAGLPFKGIPDDYARSISTELRPGSAAFSLFSSGETIAAFPAAQDSRLETLGLDGLVGAAGVAGIALSPLALGGRSLGYLLAGNRPGGGAFTADELRIHAIIAGQAAAIIDNTRLLEESRRRRRQAEALRKIAAIASSAATLNEILIFSLTEIVRLLNAEKGAIFLQDEARYTLALHRESVIGISPEAIADSLNIQLEDPGYAQTVTASQRAATLVRRSAALEGRPLYRALVDRLEVESALAVPLVVSGRSFGEIVIGSPVEDAYGTGEIEMASTAAGQIAGAIERALVKTQTDETLRKRVEELTSLTRISRELNTSFDLEGLLQLIHGEAIAATGAACGTILLVEATDMPEQRPAVTLFAGDAPGSDPLTPAEIAALQDGENARIYDYDGNSDHEPPHPGVQSALILPVRFRDEVIGLFNLHALHPGHFNQAALESAEALAIQAGIALGNAIRFRTQILSSRQIQRRHDALNFILAFRRELESENLAIPAALGRIAAGIRAVLDFQVVIISALDPTKEALDRLAACGFSEAEFERMRQIRNPWSSVQELMRPDFRFGDVYFIPADRTPVIPADFDLVLSLDPSEDRRERTYWQSQDLMFAPLLDSEGQALGVISVDAPAGRLRPDQAAFEILGMFAEQASWLLETRPRDAVPAPQTAGEENADQKGGAISSGAARDRGRAVLEVVQSLNSLSRTQEVYETLSRLLVDRLGFEISFVAEPAGAGLHMLAQAGRVPPGVNAEALLGQRNPLRHSLHTGETILVSDLTAGEAAEWQQAPLLNQLGTQSFIAVPIVGAGPSAGIGSALLGLSAKVQVEFSEDDRVIFRLLGSQVSAVLKKIQFFEQTEERLREVDLLLNFSRRLGSLSSEDIIRSLIENAMEVSDGAQASMVLLWDAGSEHLVPANPTGYPDPETMLSVRFPSGSTLPGRVFAEGQPRRVAELNIAEDYNLPYEDLIKYQSAIRQQAPIASLVVPITSAKTVLGVLVLDSFSDPDVFTEEDEALIASLARQTGLILENATLLDEANRRALQLESLTGVATTITSDLQVERITSSLLDQLERVIPFDTGTFWFRQGEALSIRAVQGFSDDEERTGLTVSIEDSRLLREMVASGQAINVQDVETDARFVSPGGFEYRSWLGIPLIAKGEVAGVIALEKKEAAFYNAEHVQVAATFAGQAAVALENARLFEESLRRTETLNERTERLDLLNRLSTAFSASLDTRYILQFTADRLREAFDCRAVTAVLIEDNGQAILAAESPETDGSAIGSPFDDGPFQQLRESFGIQIIENVEENPDTELLREFWDRHGTRAAAVVSLAAGSQLHGLLVLHGDERLSSGEIDLARTIGNQAAIAIQNARLFDRSRELTEELEQRVEARTHELELAHERTETLLGIITELSASLDMDIVLNRTLSLINRIIGAEQSTIIISNPADEDTLRRSVQGYSSPPPSGTETVSRVFNEKLATWVIHEREPALIEDLTKEERWQGIQRIGQRSVLAMPLMLGAEALGALMLFHRDPGRFTEHHLDLIQSAARQVAIAVNNAHLYLLIRDQAERLGGMLRSQQIESSRLLAILESVVDGVIVTDAAGQISVFNHAAEQILQLSTEEVTGNSLDAFTGHFGRAGQTWIETIRTWSAEPDNFVSGETYSEEIVLEDDRVLAVNLSPVFTPHEFLGTVSIFRDITHLIEVDRLKSEFVATVSHELRTPLTSIKGYVDVLLMGAAGEITEQQRRFLEIAQANTGRLNILVDDLLEVSRIEAGRISLELKPVDVPVIAQDLATDYSLRAQEEKKSIAIQIEAAANSPPALADSARVRQILDNLIGNAYNYTLDEGRIEVRFAQRDDFLEVRVSDNGVGIPAQEQEQVFERFYRGDAPLTTSKAGTGLGLSIVRHLVELHGGSIRVESQGIPGKGSAFIFTIPVYSEEESGRPVRHG